MIFNCSDEVQGGDGHVNELDADERRNQAAYPVNEDVALQQGGWLPPVGRKPPSRPVE